MATFDLSRTVEYARGGRSLTPDERLSLCVHAEAACGSDLMPGFIIHEILPRIIMEEVLSVDNASGAMLLNQLRVVEKMTPVSLWKAAFQAYQRVRFDEYLKRKTLPAWLEQYLRSHTERNQYHIGTMELGNHRGRPQYQVRVGDTTYIESSVHNSNWSYSPREGDSVMFSLNGTTLARNVRTVWFFLIHRPEARATPASPRATR